MWQNCSFTYTKCLAVRQSDFVYS